MILTPETSLAAEKLYTARGKRDPFVPLIGVGARSSAAGGLLGIESAEELVVEGIVHDEDPKKSAVVLNGSVLTTGEEMGGVKVLRIDPNGALVSVNGVETYKSLYNEESKRLAE